MQPRRWSDWACVTCTHLLTQLCLKNIRLCPHMQSTWKEYTKWLIGELWVGCLKRKKELTLFSWILPFLFNHNYMNLNYLENVISGGDLADHPAPYLSFDKRGSWSPERGLPDLEEKGKERNMQDLWDVLTLKNYLLFCWNSVLTGIPVFYLATLAQWFFFQVNVPRNDLKIT